MSVLGIDLGTTNTVAARGARVFPVGRGGASILPSTVAYPPSGATLVGADARRRRTIDPKNTIYSAKRIIGRGWHAADTQEFRSRYPFDLVERDGQSCFQTRAGVYSPVEIAATVLERVLERVEMVGLDETVIAVPSLFGDAEREATLAAGRSAGLPRPRVIDEPAATAAAYLHAGRQGTGYAAVYDLGGGTFDLAVVDCRETPHRVLGHDGDLYLGGDDVDHGLAAWAVGEVLRLHGWDLRSDESAFSRLVVECERAKVRLGVNGSATIDLTQVDLAAPDSVTSLDIDPAFMDELTSSLVRRSFGLCDEVLHRVGLKASQMDSVFVAGGGTLMPVVRRGVEQYFGQPVEYAYDPMHIVAIGAGLC